MLHGLSVFRFPAAFLNVTLSPGPLKHLFLAAPCPIHAIGFRLLCKLFTDRLHLLRVTRTNKLFQSFTKSLYFRTAPRFKMRN